MSVGIDKAFHGRKTEIEFVRNYFHHCKSCSSSLGGTPDRGRFHVNRLRAKGNS